ncbi:hypothetical protein CORC01_12672 [Colletotrichum orchidophilum]|uniref:Amidase domain-containing protein n=1 Tax=Colletotrichum orchidophilum TaxID=1209926 RepID=A0A1G4ASH6_9PEZI|nr:uncharacterized protein CORC01_12672 [Colletotrichum orchidophilum]OHE92033.1 hypothetical protein CORC01_12672 [Colletotrichum orchidophilum]
MSLRLEETSIEELLKGLDDRNFNVEDLTYIKRIEHLNPLVHSVSQINPDASDVARSKDAERQRGDKLGKLHGIPILIKDVFLTKDRLKSTSPSLKHNNFEATSVQRLRDQGAVLLGKTVPSQASGGWSVVGGQCLAPYHKEQDPSGSSSGSAVAACLGLSAAALGTETSGSLSSPAQKPSVVSIKPTVGLTSRYGVYSVSEWQDTVGVIARSVKDAAIVLTAIHGPDPNDSFTVSDPRDSEDVQEPSEATDFALACKESGLQGNMRKSLEAYETNPESLHTLADVIRYTESSEEEGNDKWGVDECLKCEKLGEQYDLESPEYLKSLEWRNQIGKQIQELLDRTNCDFILAPSIDTSANVGGCPTVGVPLGFYPEDTPISRRKSSGLVSVGPNVPFAALLVGRRWDDFNLISAAFAFEQATKARHQVAPIISSDVKLLVQNARGMDACL